MSLDTLGTARIVRPGRDATVVALALMVPRALAAAEKLKAEHGIDCEESTPGCWAGSPRW